jgi:hypothetical protein
VARLLRPIAPPAQRLACRPRWLGRQVVLCAYIGPEPTNPDPDEWRFPTKIPQIRACYYERWLATDSRRDKLYLERAYLHLFIRQEQLLEKQVLALHCDPNEAESNKHFRYKAGPHIHMSTRLRRLSGLRSKWSMIKCWGSIEAGGHAQRTEPILTLFYLR